MESTIDNKLDKDTDEGLKATEEEFKNATGKETIEEDEDNASIPGLDSYQFTWDVNHALRKFYNKLKKEMYSKYNLDDVDNVDLRILVDEIIVAKTQLHGVCTMTMDKKAKKSLPFRIKEHQKNLRENLAMLMKYTRKEPEKTLRKHVGSKGKDLAENLKKQMNQTQRSELVNQIRDMVRNKHVSKDDDESPFED